MTTRKSRIKTPLTRKDLKWHTIEEVFGEVSATKEFQKGYKEESARIKLAARIRETRIAKKMTQEDVAEKASMQQSVIARLESGEHGVSVDTLSKVANALGKQIALVESSK
ncbi:MAG: putative transcriptional regulator [Candidatus Magasanikbacteria bacterium GW2011_GWA2_50_22]|uniref:Putative transcriptional regulator n=1 Tax=Candidatus Magasanikbacteria bacterium GW2011_GWA2_50_22 TaxID=1619043 RepID=A0A0G1WF95_9BACT|nr:MAG: putative transcriptional regulator [Candidatus Magasanikbacteria bacterium GW2011_GWA2_50_22]